MSFDEVQFPTSISREALTLPRRNVDRVTLGSGFTIDNALWRNSRRSYDTGLGIRDISQLRDVIEFWEARGGRERGFRFKDWADYQATDETLDPDGSPTVQLTKTYASGGQSYIRDIRKPVPGTPSLKRGGSSYSPASIDTTTGVATLSKDLDLSITDVTASAPAEVTTSADHGLSNGETVWVTDTSLGEIDDQTWEATVIDANTISLDGSDTSGTGGSSSGSLEKYVQPSETLTWSGEFDVPVKFQENDIGFQISQFNAGSVPELLLIEDRNESV